MRAGFLLAAGVFLMARLYGAGFVEDFATDPGGRGWRTFGDAELFHWNEIEQDLEVTWDSSKPNSYFCRSLGNILAKSDDVQLSFDLRIIDIAVGLDPGKPFTFELAVGLINLREATGTNFVRGTATQSPNLLEWDYFPDSGFGATISPVIVSSNNQFIPSFTVPVELTANHVYHVQLSYSAANQTLNTTMLRDGASIGPIKPVQLGATFTDFRVDTVAISSYSDQGADGSILAHGRIDNLAVTLPDPPQPVLTWEGPPAGKAGQITFQSTTNWSYTLERTDDWKQWVQVSNPVPGNGAEQMLQDQSMSGAPPQAFYRVRLERP
jgi:hypothetical protein